MLRLKSTNINVGILDIITLYDASIMTMT